MVHEAVHVFIFPMILFSVITGNGHFKRYAGYQLIFCLVYELDLQVRLNGCDLHYDLDGLILNHRFFDDGLFYKKILRHQFFFGCDKACSRCHNSI